MVLALAACDASPDEGAAAGASDMPSRPAATAAPAPDGGAAALLDGLIRPQQKGRYAPRDDCGQEPGAAEFRRKLAEAAAKGDAEAVAALASPVVKLGFGGDDGLARMLERLKAPGGELMQELRRLLSLGCAVNPQGGLTMPWYFAQDMGDIDSYAAMLVTGEDIPLHAAADAASAVTRRISWDVVELSDGLHPEREFQAVETADGIRGYLPTAKLRSLLDYRLLANREGEGWKISAVLAGD
jgi:hypothetical protein